jgi:hypothetical protein
METQPCRGCGKPIVWAALVDERGELVTNENGSPKCIPLDPRAPVYELKSYTDRSLGADGKARECRRISDAYVSHFATCPAANQFSGRNREKKG